MYDPLLTRLYIYIYIFAFLNQSLEKIQLESKLDFAFVSSPYKLNCLDFYCYFLSKLMSIFFILFLFKYFVCEDVRTENSKLASNCRPTH